MVASEFDAKRAASHTHRGDEFVMQMIALNAVQHTAKRP